MNDKNNGIVDLLPQKLTLKERIEAQLKRAPTDMELANDYVDPADRLRVRRRKLIAAALNALFELGFADIGPDGAWVEVSAEPNVWNDLAAARRDYLHDIELLDAGRRPQLILHPTERDTTETEVPINAKVKELITWLAVIHLHQPGLDETFPTQASIIAHAAKAAGRHATSLTTSLSQYLNAHRPSDQQLTQFWDLVAMAQILAREAGDENIAFNLLLPAATALSKAKIPAQNSAHSMT